MRFYCTLIIFTFIEKLHVDAWCSNPKLNNGYDCGNVPESENGCNSKKYRGHVMYYYSTGQCRTYDDAQAYCKQHHMEMASFHERNLYLWIRVKACIYAGKEITWLGPRRIGNIWKNPDGTTVPSAVMKSSEMGRSYSSGYDCVLVGVTWTNQWFPAPCTKTAKFMCQTAIPGCKIHNIKFHIIYSEGKQNVISPKAGEYIDCKTSGNLAFFEKWTLSQVCGFKEMTSIDCRTGECRIQLKQSDKDCQIKCKPEVWSRFRKYVNKSLVIIPALIDMKFEKGPSDEWKYLVILILLIMFLIIMVFLILCYVLRQKRRKIEPTTRRAIIRNRPENYEEYYCQSQDEEYCTCPDNN